MLVKRRSYNEEAYNEEAYNEEAYKQKKRLVQDATNLMRDFVKKTSKSKNCSKIRVFADTCKFFKG